RRIDETLAEGERLFNGTALLRELTPRALDTISSLGERLCAPIFAAAVGELGVRGAAMDATELIFTDSYHGGAEPLMDATRERCARSCRRAFPFGSATALRRSGRAPKFRSRDAASAEASGRLRPSATWR